MFDICRLTLLTGVVIITSSCASLPDDVQRTESYALQNTENTKIGRGIAPYLKRHPGKSGFHVLKTGMDAFTARIVLIEKAEKSLDVQYYIWHDDLTGRVLHNRLLHAADRGVRVRLLLDDLDTAGKEQILHILNSHPNIEIRLFNPFANRTMDFVTDLSRVNHRMHNKSLTADNQATILGGRNIGDEYFDAAEDVAFSDLDVLGFGPVVKKVSSSFDLYWNSQWVYPLSAFPLDEPIKQADIKAYRQQSDQFMEEVRQSKYAAALRENELTKMIKRGDKLDLTWGKWFLVYDDPSKVEADEVTAETHLGPKLHQAMDETRKEVIIVSPYFVPGEKITAYLNGLVKKGISVRILTNSLAANDVSIVHAGYMRYREDLVNGGVELYEYKRTFSKEEMKQKKKEKKQSKWTGSSHASLHAKSFTFDGRFLFIGSFNLDARSIALNTEMGVFFESPEYAKAMSKAFDEKGLIKAYRIELKDDQLEWVTLEDGNKVSYDVEPDTSWWKRFTTGFLSIFVIESQL
jgi:putative cardiolipin synthase